MPSKDAGTDYTNNNYSIDGNTIWVKTLDLNLPFSQIAGQSEKLQNIIWGR